MDQPCSWQMLSVFVWLLAGSVSLTDCCPSPEDVLLLKDEDNPKCFTRTEKDFTCFFETVDNRMYDFFYSITETNTREKWCNMSIQRTEERAFLHVCSFPEEDIYLYTDTHLKVVQRDNSTILYTRTVSVEDQILLDAPVNVSLCNTGQVGQLQVSWHTQVPKYWEPLLHHRIRYSSKQLVEKIIKVQEEQVHRFTSLVPGEEVQVQIAVKRALTESTGHWSHWSQSVVAIVPQSADDISLLCFTSDLQNVTCQWNRTKYGEHFYKLFYKMTLSDALDWTECSADATDVCFFHGEKSTIIRVKLSSDALGLGRTFYTEPFTLNGSIKTSPPAQLRGKLQTGKLCVTWDNPLPSLSPQLEYEVGYQVTGDAAWKILSLKGPEADTCLEVSPGKQYLFKVRSKPNGLFYSGHWSDWSHVITGDIPTDMSTLLLLCIPVVLLVVVVSFIAMFSTHLRKLKQYIWPPVPNLDKVLEGFLTEINGEKWDCPLTEKQCSEETASYVVEVMPAEDASALGKSSLGSTHFLSLQRSYSLDGKAEFEKVEQPEYVTLDSDNTVVYSAENQYTLVGEKELEMVDELCLKPCDCTCTDGSDRIPPCSHSDFLNCSYSPMAEPLGGFDCKDTAGRGPGNLYTNIPL
ncbi:thrombopoietin receptor isoform X2 [Thalassophryne amazonica]|uniref:thrombopoietin receptor isoform X2 n=1 Tax=Thalassophryne amazonica TaxID=390379 RepID=UPI001470AC54|nr:thrombopoietin receptor isoform X2 [Thalassophryne amazonica]